MTASQKPQHLIHTLPGYDTEIGRWFWALEDTRHRTKHTLGDLDGTTLDWLAPITGLSVGTLLYHIAAIEID